jgi:hypothetical protein
MTTDDRDKKGFMIILLGRVDMHGDCLFGRTVIGRENISGLKLNVQQRKGMLKFKPNELDSIISNARMSLLRVLI